LRWCKYFQLSSLSAETSERLDRLILLFHGDLERLKQFDEDTLILSHQDLELVENALSAASRGERTYKKSFVYITLARECMTNL
jgi:hypothetical protein